MKRLLTRQCHQLKTGAFVLCEKTAKQMQLVGAGLCSARQDTPNYRKSSANPYALTRLAVEADAGHSRSRRRSVTDVGLPLAGTHRPGGLHRVLRKSSVNSQLPNGPMWASAPTILCESALPANMAKHIQRPFSPPPQTQPINPTKQNWRNKL